MSIAGRAHLRGGWQINFLNASLDHDQIKIVGRNACALRRFH